MIGRWVIEHAQTRMAVTTEEDLKQRLLTLPLEEDPSLLLIHESGDHMFVAFRSDSAVVIFRPVARDKRHLSVSVNPGFKPSSDADYVEFMVGGTATPIPKDRCIPRATGVEVALHYFSRAALPKTVHWVEG